jgi:CheY-like chemotaxis protein
MERFQNKNNIKSCCGQRSFKLIFMDIAMPVMDGYKATEAIRAFEKD